MPSERQRRAEIVRLIVTTRERFPHTPQLTRALRRVIWRYMTEAPVITKRKKRSCRAP